MSNSSTNAPPNITFSNNDTLVGLFRQVLNNSISSTDGVLPAKVIAYSPATETTPASVQVQPLIKIVDTNGNQISRAQIASVPVLKIGGGGFILNFPVNPGDLGWIVANDRDISQFIQTFSESAPNTFRKKNFSDAIFIPGILVGYTLASEDLGHLTIQNLAGTVKISLGPDTITLTAPNVVINGVLNVSDIVISGGSTPNATGTLFIDGDIKATGSITPDVPP